MSAFGSYYFFILSLGKTNTLKRKRAKLSRKAGFDCFPGLSCSTEKFGALDRSLAAERVEQATELMNQILQADGFGADNVAKVNEEFYKAINRRDFETLQSLWLFSDQISCAHILCEDLVTGYDRVLESWSAYLQSMTTQVEVKNERIYIRGTVAWVTHEAVATPKDTDVQSDYLRVDFLATNILQWTNNSWLFVHHHASCCFICRAHERDLVNIDTFIRSLFCDMSSSDAVPSSNDVFGKDSDEEPGTSGIEVRQLSVAEAEYEIAGAEDDESSDEDSERNLRRALPRIRPSLLEGEEEQPSFSLADETNAGPVTAFNLEEELDEGYVDKEGNFVGFYFENRVQNLEGVVSSSDEEEESKREKRKPIRRPRVERDDWADAIEVLKPTYAMQASNSKEELKSLEDSDMVDDDSPERTKELYAKLARLLHSGESILRALKRLAGSRKDASAKREFNEVTELADSLLNRGEYSIYEETRESCLEKGGLGEFGNSCSSSKETRKRKRDGEPLNDLHTSPRDQSKLHWELKWSHDPSKVYGPFSTEQLRNWQAWGYFNEAEAFVRDTDVDSSFHIASSIDFSKYGE
ncbi:CD2 antigen cytoplasmic tail-binding protein 2 [Galdieria sulphuraria]|nr:CD2 antigen cytoplasmic tail-binding protein 2 [Galdieria sulphuraria]